MIGETPNEKSLGVFLLQQNRKGKWAMQVTVKVTLTIKSLLDLSYEETEVTVDVDVLKIGNWEKRAFHKAEKILVHTNELGTIVVTVNTPQKLIMIPRFRVEEMRFAILKENEKGDYDDKKQIQYEVDR